jgi:hypothetical protein
MKELKFSGREASVIRAVDFATGTIGAEILVKTRIEALDALDILNGLLDAGYIETSPATIAHVSLKDFYNTIFEVNPAYVHPLRKALAHKF